MNHVVKAQMTYQDVHDGSFAITRCRQEYPPQFQDLDIPMRLSGTCDSLVDGK